MQASSGLPHTSELRDGRQHCMPVKACAMAICSVPCCTQAREYRLWPRTLLFACSCLRWAEAKPLTTCRPSCFCAGTNYIETLRVQVHANCRIRRIYFSDRLYSEEELPPEFKL